MSITDRMTQEEHSITAAMGKLSTPTKDAMALNAIADEISAARSKHKPLNSSHEAFAVIKEELDEFWDEVRKKSAERSRENMKNELVQTAAMCVRAISDLNLCPPHAATEPRVPTPE